MPKDLVITLASDTLNDALFQSFFGNSNFLDHGFEQQGRQSREFLEDLSVLELILLYIFKKEAIFLNKVEQGVSQDGRGKVLAHVIIHPLLILTQLVFFWGLRFLFFRSEKPLEHKISNYYYTSIHQPLI